MEFNDYQVKAMSTCMDSCDNFGYMFLNLVGEVGEFSSKVAKAIRKGNGGVGCEEENHIWFNSEVYDEEVGELRKEAGDILWQLSGLCNIMGWSLEEVAEENLAKLASRKERGKIDGNGDNR